MAEPIQEPRLSAPPRRLRGIPDLAEAPAEDPIIAAELARRARAREAAATPAAPELPPVDVAELIGRLPGAPPHWAQLAAEDLVRRFGTEKDRRLWGQMHRIARGVWAGRIDPAPVLDAYRQAMGPAIENRGAKFWAAFQVLAGLHAADLKAMDS